MPPAGRCSFLARHLKSLQIEMQVEGIDCQTLTSDRVVDWSVPKLTPKTHLPSSRAGRPLWERFCKRIPGAGDNRGTFQSSCEVTPQMFALGRWSFRHCSLMDLVKFNFNYIDLSHFTVDIFTKKNETWKSLTRSWKGIDVLDSEWEHFPSVHHNFDPFIPTWRLGCAEMWVGSAV